MTPDTEQLAKYLFGEMTFGEYWAEAKTQGKNKILHFQVLDKTPEAEAKFQYEIDNTEEREEHLVIRTSNPNHFVVAVMVDWNYKIKPMGCGLVVEDKGVRVAIKFEEELTF